MSEFKSKTFVLQSSWLFVMKVVQKKSFIFLSFLFYNSDWLLESRKQIILVLIFYLSLQVQQIAT